MFASFYIFFLCLPHTQQVFTKISTPLGDRPSLYTPLTVACWHKHMFRYKLGPGTFLIGLKLVNKLFTQFLKAKFFVNC